MESFGQTNISEQTIIQPAPEIRTQYYEYNVLAMLETLRLFRPWLKTKALSFLGRRDAKYSQIQAIAKELFVQEDQIHELCISNARLISWDGEDRTGIKLLLDKGLRHGLLDELDHEYWWKRFHPCNSSTEKFPGNNQYIPAQIIPIQTRTIGQKSKGTESINSILQP